MVPYGVQYQVGVQSGGGGLQVYELPERACHGSCTLVVNDTAIAFKRSAYKEADIDTVRIVRELAAAGKLDASPLH